MLAVRCDSSGFPSLSYAFGLVPSVGMCVFLVTREPAAEVQGIFCLHFFFFSTLFCSWYRAGIRGERPSILDRTTFVGRVQHAQSFFRRRSLRSWLRGHFTLRLGLALQKQGLTKSVQCETAIVGACDYLAIGPRRGRNRRVIGLVVTSIRTFTQDAVQVTQAKIEGHAKETTRFSYVPRPGLVGRAPCRVPNTQQHLRDLSVGAV